MLLTYWIFEDRYYRGAESVLQPDIQLWLCVFLDVHFCLDIDILPQING